MNPLLLLGLAGGGIALFAATSSGGSPAWAAFRRTANKFAKGKDATALAAYGFGFVDAAAPNGIDALVEEFRKQGQSGSSIKADLEKSADLMLETIASIVTLYRKNNPNVQIRYVDVLKKLVIPKYKISSLDFPVDIDYDAMNAAIVRSAQTKYPEFTGNELVPQFEPVKVKVAIGYGCSGCAGRNGIGYGCSGCAGRNGIGYGCSSCARIGGRLYRRTRQSLRGRGIKL